MLSSEIIATALVTPLTDNGREVRLVGAHLDQEIITPIQGMGIHPDLGLKIPGGMAAHQLEDAPRAFEGVEFIMNKVGSFEADWADGQSASLLRPRTHAITLAKGMQADDDGNLTILPRALASRLPERLRSRVSVSTIAGPSIAGEMVVHRHTGVVFTGEDPEVLTRWRGLSTIGHYHMQTNTDFVGVEMCTATKNCYVLGTSFIQDLLDVMGEAAGDHYVNYNYRAALFGQASMEMIQFMELLGGRPTTPIGLPGIGDYFVTSMNGRNVRCGQLVGSGMTFDQTRAQMSDVTLEGIAAIVVIGRAVIRLTERGIVPPERFPLLRHLCEMVGLDQPVAVPWDSFFGGDGSGQA